MIEDVLRRRIMKGYRKMLFGLMLWAVMMLAYMCTARADAKALGTGEIGNPTTGNGGWSKVYFGSKDSPILFNVLKVGETAFGGKTMLLDCATILETKAFDENTSYSNNLIKDGTKITVPYTLTGSANQMSVVMTDGTWSDGNGWSTTEKPKYYGKLDSKKSFTLPTSYNPSWNTYIIAEKINTGNKTDHASKPVEITIPSANTPKESFTVTFKVVGGEWNQGGSGDKVVSLSRYKNEDLLLKLDASDIPGVGNKPYHGFEEGSWDTVPNTEMVISRDITYTYTYVEKPRISETVTFKVIDGSWDDGATENKTVTLSGHEGDTLKLSADQIPAVGKNPNDGYKKGSWDKAPSTNTAITASTTYTYKYAKKEPTPKEDPTPKKDPTPKPDSRGTDIALNAGLKLNWSGSKITLKYGAVKGATGYDIYASYCGTSKYKKIATEKGCSITITMLDGKKLNKKKAAKFYVVAKNGKTELATSLKVHVAGPKNRYTHAKKIKISKKGYTLKKGKTVKLKPTLVRKNKKKKRLPNYHAPKFRYATSNKNVATVDKNGKVKAVGKGTCDVYAYAVNGMTQKVKFTVN